MCGWLAGWHICSYITWLRDVTSSLSRPSCTARMRYRSSEMSDGRRRQSARRPPPSIIIVVDLIAALIHSSHLARHINSDATSSAANPPTCNRCTPLPSQFFFSNRQADWLVFINTYQVCRTTGSLSTSLLHDLILFSWSAARHSPVAGNFRFVTWTNSTSASKWYYTSLQAVPRLQRASCHLIAIRRNSEFVASSGDSCHCIGTTCTWSL